MRAGANTLAKRRQQQDDPDDDETTIWAIRAAMAPAEGAAPI